MNTSNPSFPPLKLDALRVAVPDGDQDRILLERVDLEIAAGEIVVLTGASGSGKSTLLAITGLLRRTDTGEVIIAGETTRSLSSRQRSTIRGREIGIIYQSANLLPSLTAREQLEVVFHIAGRSRSEGRRRAVELLEVVGLSHRMDALPQHLSGGERQRVGVARALVASPSVLLADEPTASLDPALSEDITRLIAHEVHQRGLAALLVTHDDAPLEVADRQVHLAGGTLTEIATSRS
ncbi:MAG TPA: ABC transporter ATP-binding protein [Acidimicrobiales bacterium]|nr:ABC transporter ATP-binding protein [Acidimicrobiales bacterium]